MNTQPFCHAGIAQARVLVIGHDPRLQDSDTQASYAFFADTYFGPPRKAPSEQAKFALARAAYACVDYLTEGRCPAELVALTNLCNSPLPHAPKGRTVYISEDHARTGIAEIRALLAAG